jgi:hypothetical protein
MKVQTQSHLSRLSTARRWLELFEADDPDNGEAQTEQDSAAIAKLIKFTKSYRRELIHSSALAERYENEFDRYLELKEAVIEADATLEYMKTLEGSDRPPCEAQALVQWIFGAVLDMVMRLNAIERDSPDFPKMRAEYQDFCKKHTRV